MRAATIVFVAMLAASPARAQSCHGAPLDADANGVRASVRSDTAAFRTTRYEGHYEGIFAGVVVANETFSASTTLPAYRILRNGLASYGVGDVPLAARARLFTLDAERVRFGVSATVTLPTGDPEKDLGMGHFMLMPGIWGSAHHGVLSLDAELAYGRALTGSGGAHAHHHTEDGSSPLVDPMNHSELAPLVAATVDVSAPIALRIGAYGGFPTSSGEGASRTIAFAGVAFEHGRFAARVQGEAPLVGDPFTAKLVLELAQRL